MNCLPHSIADCAPLFPKHCYRAGGVTAAQDESAEQQPDGKHPVL